jgi:hypothetical protein
LGGSSINSVQNAQINLIIVNYPAKISELIDGWGLVFDFYHHDHSQRSWLMKLSQPKFIVWLVALLLGVVALLGEVGVFAAIDAYTFWVAFVGLALMLLATAVKGL